MTYHCRVYNNVDHWKPVGGGGEAGLPLQNPAQGRGIQASVKLCGWSTNTNSDILDDPQTPTRTFGWSSNTNLDFLDDPQTLTWIFHYSKNTNISVWQSQKMKDKNIFDQQHTLIKLDTWTDLNILDETQTPTRIFPTLHKQDLGYFERWCRRAWYHGVASIWYGMVMWQVCGMVWWCGKCGSVESFPWIESSAPVCRTLHLQPSSHPAAISSSSSLP